MCSKGNSRLFTTTSYINYRSPWRGKAELVFPNQIKITTKQRKEKFKAIYGFSVARNYIRPVLSVCRNSEFCVLVFYSHCCH